MTQQGQIELQPALLAELFGPPDPSIRSLSSGTYRFRMTTNDVIDLYDWRLTREATGSREQRPAAALWASEECWKLEVATTNPKLLPEFYTWLRGRITAAVQDRVQASLDASRAALAAGSTDQAWRRLWEAETWLPPDPRLEDPALGAQLSVVRQAIRQAESPLGDPTTLLHFRYGLANAPDSPQGEDHLVLHPDGLLQLEQRQPKRTRRWSARCAPEVIARFKNILLQIGFPNIPPGELRPGPSFWIVEAERGAQRLSATFSTLPYRDQAPHHLLFDIGVTLCACIRNEPDYGLADSLGIAVHSVQALT